QLKKLRSREGQPLFQKVVTSEKNCEIICTLSSKITLDHTLEYNNKSIDLRNIVVRKGLPRGIHTDAPPGIIAIHGPGIEQGKEILGADVYDVSPTALYILGLPVAKDFDSEMLVQSFDSQYTTDNPVHTLPSYGERNLKSGLTTTKGDKRMLDELRALGYIN
ncbi:hypothetical protein K8T06_15930, partial [bacterium]|nr:hypothetical protein [bacterium]